MTAIRVLGTMRCGSPNRGHMRLSHLRWREFIMVLAGVANFLN